MVVGPTSWNGIKDLDKLDLPKEDRNLIVTVHYYSPFPFTHQGAAFAGLKDKTGVPWNGTEKEQQAIVKDFDKAQAWAEKHQRPIYLGEFGVYDKAEMASRVRWTSFVTRQAEKRAMELGLVAVRRRFRPLRRAAGSLGRAHPRCTGAERSSHDRTEEVDADGMLETHHQKCPPPEPAMAVALGGERVQSRPRGSLL